MGQTKAQKIIKQLSGTVQKQTPIATDMFIPNHSGDNSAGDILKTPVNDTDIPNKKYVDDAIAAIPVVTDYWKTTTAQTGLTGDKTGSFDLTTTGNLSANEATFTGDVLADLAATECIQINKPADAGGTCHPLTITGGWDTPIAQTQIRMGSSQTNNTTKFFGFTGETYALANSPMSLLVGQGGVSTNLLLWGGSATARLSGPTIQSFILKKGVAAGLSDTTGLDIGWDNRAVPTSATYTMAQVPSTGKFAVGNGSLNSKQTWFYYPSSDVAWIDTNHAAVPLRIGDANNDGTGTDYTEFESTGFMEANGAAEAWDDQQVNISTVKLPTSQAPSWVSFKGSEVLEFSASGTNKIYFTAQLSHKYKQGEDIEFHIHTSYPDSNAGNVRWKFTHSWSNIDTAIPAETTVNTTIAAPTRTDYHELDEIAETITGTSKNISSVLLCCLEREGGDELDTYAGDVKLLALDFHIPLNTIGSRTETAK
jgi:hypothetical protein